MSRITRHELARLLGKRPVGPPPADLAQRIKAEIPRPFTAGQGLEAALGRAKVKRFTVPLSAFVALAGILVLALAVALVAYLETARGRKRPADQGPEAGAASVPVLRAGVDVPRPKLLRRGTVYWPETSVPRPVTVELELTIDREGNVRAARLVGGPTGPLAEGLLRAVRTWRYEPTVVDGEQVEVLLTETFQF